MEIDAKADFDRVAEARRAIADRLATPWWYLPAFGLMLALPALGLGVGRPQGLPLLFAGLTGSLTLTFWSQRRSGVSYTGSIRGRHDGWFWTLVAALVVLYVGALVMGFGAAPLSLSWIPAAIVLPLTVGLGRGYERALSTTLRTSE
jgi:hypothetical protein